MVFPLYPFVRGADVAQNRTCDVVGLHARQSRAIPRQLALTGPTRVGQRAQVVGRHRRGGHSHSPLLRLKTYMVPNPPLRLSSYDFILWQFSFFAC